MKTNITCKEAVGLILKKEEGNVTFRQQVLLWKHFAACSLCRLFSKQNSMINKAVAKSHDHANHVLTPESKEEILQAVIQQPGNN